MVDSGDYNSDCIKVDYMKNYSFYVWFDTRTKRVVVTSYGAYSNREHNLRKPTKDEVKTELITDHKEPVNYIAQTILIKLANHYDEIILESEEW